MGIYLELWISGYIHLESLAYLIDFNKRLKKVGTKYIEATRCLAGDSLRGYRQTGLSTVCV